MTLKPAAVEPVPTDPDRLRELARRAGEASGAWRVILFGSVARGEAGPRSDLDLLLVFEDDADWSAGLDRAQLEFWPRFFPLDLVPMLRSHLEDRDSLMARAVARDGRVLYERETAGV